MSFLKFEEGVAPRGYVTKVWRVLNLENFTLGVIRWHAPWRRYWFESNGGGFDVACLREVAEFIERQMEARRVNGE